MDSKDKWLLRVATITFIAAIIIISFVVIDLYSKDSENKRSFTSDISDQQELIKQNEKRIEQNEDRLRELEDRKPPKDGKDGAPGSDGSDGKNGITRVENHNTHTVETRNVEVPVESEPREVVKETVVEKEVQYEKPEFAHDPKSNRMAVRYNPLDEWTLIPTTCLGEVLCVGK